MPVLMSKRSNTFLVKDFCSLVFCKYIIKSNGNCELSEFLRFFRCSREFSHENPEGLREADGNYHLIPTSLEDICLEEPF